MPDLGAQAALAGYRKQALLNLDRILAPERDDQTSFHPDGIEDLDIMGPDGELLELIQVKAYSDDLTLSHFSPEKPSSFLRRAATLNGYPNLKITVASFGAVGPELREAWQGSSESKASISRKLQEKGYSEPEIERLFSTVRFEEVDESAVRDRVFMRLRESLAGGDPESALDLLTIWLYYVAEQGRRITQADVVARINAIGRYLSERAAHHREWFTSIIPLDESLVSEHRRAELEGEYMLGAAARYEHIAAGLDVSRPAPLNEIHQAFVADRRVVIVHGPSGQGKSSLGFRFLHDYVPHGWRFAVRAIENRQHALSVAAALAGHLRSFDAPMYVYIDVSPRDVEWQELVQALLREENARVLVTIREEDLARSSFSPVELGNPMLISLDFDEPEARRIYDQLVARRPADAFLSFAEAWDRFGNGGPLMEFVHLVTQSESLEARLGAQVRRLRDEVRKGNHPQADMDFLRVVSVAGAYEARVNVASLARELDLTDPVRTLELLECEYLVRRSEDGRFAEALHPIRSSVLSVQLNDPLFNPWSKSAVACLRHIPESDLEAFLLYSYARHPGEAELLTDAVMERPLTTWNAVAGVFRALLWRAIREYVERNQPLIGEVRQKVGTGWSVMLMADLAGVNPDNEQHLLVMDSIQPGVMEAARQFRARQTEPSELFAQVSGWLERLAARPGVPVTIADWAGLAEIHFWATRLGVARNLVELARRVDLSNAVGWLPLPILGEVILSLSYAPGEQCHTFARGSMGQAIQRFREETLTVWIEETNDCRRAHFIIPADALAAGKLERLTGTRSSDDQLFDRARSRAELLRQMWPGKELYGVQGYGHQLRLIELPYDSTRFPGISVNYLLPRWMPATNATFSNLANLQYRPATWRDYADILMELRRAVVSCFDQLRRGLVAHFRSDKPTRLFDRHVDRQEWNRALAKADRIPELPRVAVDEWGFVAEGMERPLAGGDQGGQAGPHKARGTFVLDRHRALLNAVKKFSGPLANFLRQAVPFLAVNSLLPRTPLQDRRNLLMALTEAQGAKTDEGFLSTYNLAEAWRHLAGFQSEFRIRFGSMYDERALSRLESSETAVFENLWALWYQFYAHPERQWVDPGRSAIRESKEVLDNLRAALLQQFRVLPQELASIEVLADAFPWEGRPALWLRMDVTEPKHMYAALPVVVQAIKHVIGPVRLRSEEQFALDTHWHAVVLVPITGGVNLEGMVWRFHPFSIYQEKEFDENHWMMLPVLLPDESAQALGIVIERAPGLQSVRTLQTIHAQLWLLVAHLSDLRRIPEEIDSVGGEILSRYIEKLAEQIQDARSKFMDAWLTLYSEVLEEENFVDRPGLIEIHDLLLELRPCFSLAGDEGDTDEGEEIGKWADRLRLASGVIEAVRLLRTVELHGTAPIVADE